MTAIHARTALLPGGWARNVRIEIAGGAIAAVTAEVPPEAGDDRRHCVVPAVPNLHSHAFQRAMAGLAETRGPADDSFWSWRAAMYKFALGITPGQVEAVAAQLYMEMLEAGFSRVGEFHYLHNDRDGSHYANIGEMAERIGAASAETGIGLTLLPVFYAHAGFGGKAPADGQRRFVHSIDSFALLMEAAARVVKTLPGAVLGLAPHSLRAVTADELEAVLPLARGGPIHIHIAEQAKEVIDCIAWSGAPPVEWLLGNAPVDGRWCLVHATHMSPGETEAMAARRAIAGLCPITEANLGDGVFAAPLFLDSGGRFGIGSDSNVLVSLAEELRMLEYSQRLLRQARNVIAAPGASTGRRLFEEALAGGAAALGVRAGLSPGSLADIVALDANAAPHLSEDRLMDYWIFTGKVPVDTVWVAGRKHVDGGRHRAREAISARFRKAMVELLAA